MLPYVVGEVALVPSVAEGQNFVYSVVLVRFRSLRLPQYCIDRIQRTVVLSLPFTLTATDFHGCVSGPTLPFARDLLD